jgi:hypothetical protein
MIAITFTGIEKLELSFPFFFLVVILSGLLAGRVEGRHKNWVS